VIAIEAVRGAASIQDGGRRGHVHEGVPRGGALVPELLARANVALGNAWDAPAIELEGALVVKPHVAVRIATDDGVVRAVGAGERCEIANARYVAIAGGIDAREQLGGRGALPSAGIGTWLRRGDELRALSRPSDGATTIAPGTSVFSDDPIRVIPGPDLDRFGPSALPTLLSSELTITRARDRTGTRLAGPRLMRRDTDAAASMPMVRGAIQVPASGEAIVLGPDHPTTGGYPVIAVVVRADLGRFAAKRPGDAVRFIAVSIDVARAVWRAGDFVSSRNNVR
jgi:biotin-dependent carboxylase-like uncharacterized protein